jgi:hypothetical protein
MDSPTFSPNSFLNLLMDSQGGASSSLPISLVLEHLGLQQQVVDKRTILVSFGYFWSTIGSLFKKQIGKIS